MAAEITDITQRNQPDIDSMIAHILTDLHDALRMLTEQGKLQAEHDKLLQEYRPLLDRFAHPLASKLTGGRRAR